jgi:hypothetical protein
MYLLTPTIRALVLVLTIAALVTLVVSLALSIPYLTLISSIWKFCVCVIWIPFMLLGNS